MGYLIEHWEQVRFKIWPRTARVQKPFRVVLSFGAGFLGELGKRGVASEGQRLNVALAACPEVKVRIAPRHREKFLNL